MTSLNTCLRSKPQAQAGGANGAVTIMSVWCPFPKRRARSLHVVECELCVDDPLGLELVLQFVHLGYAASLTH
jgi:hypothetical protein